MDLRDITEFNSPERQAELVRTYGRTASSWDEVESWDDIVIKEKKALVSELISENLGNEKCPFLSKLGDYFYYCGARNKQLVKMGYKETGLPALESSQYNSQTDHFSMQIWCLQPEKQHCACVNYQNK